MLLSLKKSLAIRANVLTVITKKLTMVILVWVKTSDIDFVSIGREETEKAGPEGILLVETQHPGLPWELDFSPFL